MQKLGESVANIKSAEKRARQTKVKNLRNRMHKSALATQMKKFNKAIDNRDVKLAEELLAPTVALIDKSETKGILHINNASRKKSQVYSHFRMLQEGKLPVKHEKIKKETKKQIAEREAREAALQAKITRSELKAQKVAEGKAGKDARSIKRAEKADKKAAVREEKAVAKVKEAKAKAKTK